MAASLTTREKVGHLYRRFGLGARPEDFEKGLKEGVEGTLDRLLDFKGCPESPESISEFFWREKEEPDLNTWRVRTYWIYRMLNTERPLLEKLAFFWHSSFAVSDGKVEDGPMMADYLTAIHQNSAGRFLPLLQAMSKNPAMMRYLDMQRSMRGNPNENFAREVMELFTLGIGNYTEEDVKEVARALTGWGYVQIFWEMPGNSETKLRESLKYDRPFSSFAYMPAMHDPTPKTVLGKTGAFDGDEVLEMLADHPVTAKRTALRLWKFFGCENPKESAVEREAKVFRQSKGDVRRVLESMARSKEFWEPDVVRQLPKSPVDFAIPIARQMGAGKLVNSLRKSDADRYTMIPQRAFEQAAHLGWVMELQGLNLLWPPTVEGWHWGQAWLTPETMARRFQFRGMEIWAAESKEGYGCQYVREAVKAKAPADSAAMAVALFDHFDVVASPEALKAATDRCEASGGTKCLDEWGNFAGVLHDTLRLMVAMPGTHLG
jgi:uncharacterized protein (DUF1800 family)